ncbi:MAG: DUF1345 domain-containing protein [Paludibacteraceae bacterium]
MKATDSKNNILIEMHPLVRFFISLLPAIILYISVPAKIDLLLKLVISWGAFALIFLILSWCVIFIRTVPQIKKKAPEDDGGVAFVFFMVIVSSFAGMFSVLLLLISQDSATNNNPLFIPACISGMILSWAMVHTVYVFHYAHEYYGINTRDASTHAGGLDFPGEKLPDYIDFAYFSFVMGCTFQVSDVQITSRRIRRIALVHGVLSFILNTFVVALTINLIAGLGK